MKQPVFLLGAGRSGTKILRDCLGAAEDVAMVPYDVGYVWKYGNQSINHDELLPEQAKNEVVKYVRMTMDNMGRRASGGKEFNILLEKSVPNTLRPAFMRKIFPEAKFIHLVRDGRDVVESAMRNWETPSDTGYFWGKLRYFPVRNAPYALWYAANRLRRVRKSNDVQTWGPRYKGIQEDANTQPLLDVCARQWLRCVETSHRQLADFPQSQVIEVSYEDFVKNSDTIKSLCEFSGIVDAESVLEFHRKRIKPKSVSESRSRLSTQELQRIAEITGTMLAAYGYKDL